MIPLHQAASGVLIVSESGRVLMVATLYRDALVLPGGIIERDESPAHAAEREVLEETGLHVTVTRLLAVEHLPAQLPSRTSGLRFVFDCDPVADDVPLTPQPGEVTELLWLEREQAIARHTERGRHRLRAVFDAHDQSTTTYLDGDRLLDQRPGSA